jgi:hypothetical protein
MTFSSIPDCLQRGCTGFQPEVGAIDQKNIQVFRSLQNIHRFQYPIPPSQATHKLCLTVHSFLSGPGTTTRLIILCTAARLAKGQAWSTGFCFCSVCSFSSSSAIFNSIRSRFSLRFNSVFSITFRVRNNPPI